MMYYLILEKKAMDEYKWSKEELIAWLETMLTTSCDKFLNDNEIKVYLGTSDYELKYYNEREIENHKYAFHTNDSTWDRLVNESENKVSASHAYDRIWVLNIAFLQLAIIKNATFVLVTPTRQYYDYEKHNAKILPGETRPRFYSRELKYIHDAGYKWKNFDVKLEHARKG